MKLWENAMNEISPDLIAGAMEYEKAAVKPRAAKSLRKKWIPAACLLLGLVLIGGGLLLFPKRESREGRPDGETAQEPLTLPSSSDAPTEAYPAGSDTPPEVLPTITEKLDDYSEIWKADRQWEEGIETFGASYHTEILDGPFAGYQSSYVCEEALIGEKLGEAALNGRWYYIGTHGVLQEQWNPFEDLQAEVFAIRGLSPDAAVALRFSQAGSVLTTDHFYTYLNPKTALPRLSVFFTGSQAGERLTKSGGQATLEVEKASAQAVTRSYYHTDESAAGAIAQALLALDGPAAEEISLTAPAVNVEIGWKKIGWDKPFVETQFTEDTKITALLRKNNTPPVKVDAGIEEVVENIVNHNFVPVVDDRNVLMGIVTRRRVLQELLKK